MPHADSGADYAIDVAGLTKSFGGRPVVRDVSIRVGRGRICGFLGPNGSGKTTTIRLLCGLLTPDAGTGTCLGFDIRKQSAAIKREVGYMTQRFSFYEDLSIRENLDFTARVYDVPDRADPPVDPANPNQRPWQLLPRVHAERVENPHQQRDALPLEAKVMPAESLPPTVTFQGEHRTRDAVVLFPEERVADLRVLNVAHGFSFAASRSASGIAGRCLRVTRATIASCPHCASAQVE